ncbi:calpain-3-like [Tautogolabrus adspersus]
MKQTQSYTYNRELVEEHSLEPGEYVIIPSTMKPYMDAEFALSVFTKSDAKITPHDGHDDHDDEEEEADHEEKEENLILPEVPGKKDEEDTKDSVHALFKRFADQNGELSAFQLRKLLKDQFPIGSKWGFEYETCRSLIALVDVDRNRRMTITEFRNLWKKITEYKKIFDRADLNDNGSLSDYEVQKAIQASGLDTNDAMVKLYVFRYSGYSSTNLESFITMMMRLEKMSNVFKDKSSGGVIHLTWDEWSNSTMYN